MHVVVRRLAPAPFGVGLHAEIRLDHGRPARFAELAVDLERLDLVDRVLGLAEIEISAVESGVRAGESATRAEGLGDANHLGCDLDRVTWPSLLDVDLRAEGEKVAGGAGGIGRRQRRDAVEPNGRVPERRRVGAESGPGEGPCFVDLRDDDGVVLEQPRRRLQSIDRAAVVACCFAHLSERAPRTRQLELDRRS